MGNCYSADHITEDHIHTDITCNIEEPQQKFTLAFFSRLAVLSWSSMFTQCTPVIVLLLGKMSSIITHFAFQNTVAITLPADGCVLTSLSSGAQALPTDDSELYSVAHNNEPKFHLQSPDAKENHLLPKNASTRRCILMLWLPFANR